MLILSFQYRPKARRIPMLTGVCTLGLLIAVNVGTLQKRSGGPSEKKSPADTVDEHVSSNPSDDLFAKKEWVIILWVVGLTAAVYLIGFLLAIPLYLFLFLFLFAKENWKVSLGMSVGVFVTIYLIFVKVLHVHVHKGILF